MRLIAEKHAINRNLKKSLPSTNKNVVAVTVTNMRRGIHSQEIPPPSLPSPPHIMPLCKSLLVKISWSVTGSHRVNRERLKAFSQTLCALQLIFTLLYPYVHVHVYL